jgi:hypothetical protein
MPNVISISSDVSRLAETASGHIRRYIVTCVRDCSRKIGATISRRRMIPSCGSDRTTVAANPSPHGWPTPRNGGLHLANPPCVLVLLTLLVSLAASTGSSAQVVHDAAIMNPFFAAPIPRDQPTENKGRNAVFFDMLQSNREPPILLARDMDRMSLLVGTDLSSFGTVHPLPIHAGVHLAEGAGETIWIGGVTGTSVTVAGAPRSQAYLAKVDRLGHFFWEREFGGQSKRSIQSMASLQSGDVVVSGQDDERTWLARVSSDGDIIWERFVGLGKGSAIASFGGNIALVGLNSYSKEDASNSPDPDYREDVVVWLFSSSGELLDHRVIRENINSNPSKWAADVRIQSAADSIYVSSAWTLPDRKPFELTKLDYRLKPLWRNQGQDFATLPSNQACFSPPMIELSNGDVLTSCRVGADEFALSDFNLVNGDVSEVTVRMPKLPANCDEDWPLARVFLKETQPATIWIFGSPPDGIGAKACGWIGQAKLPHSN